MRLLAFCLIYAGFCCLCLSMSKHYRQVFGAAPSVPMSRLLRWAGWCLLLCSWGGWLLTDGGFIGSLLFIGLLPLAGLPVALLLPYRPRWPMYLASLGVAAGLLLLPITS